MIHQPHSLPPGWSLGLLGDVAEIVSGSTPSRDVSDYWGGDVRWASIQDVHDRPDGIVSDTREKITDAGYRSCSTQLVPPGTVLFTSRAPIGLVAVAGVELCTNQGFKNFVPSQKISSRFLYHYLRYVAPRIDALGTGATFREVSKSTIARFTIAYPSIREQEKVANILDRAEAIRVARHRSLALTDDLLRATFLEMFGPDGHSEFPRKKLGDILEFITSGSRGWAQYYSEEGDYFIRIQNVLNDELDLTDVIRVSAPSGAEAERTRVRAGDVLLSITADLGRTAVVPPLAENAFINQHLAILRTSAVDPEYLASFLSSPDGHRQLLRMNRDVVKAGLNFDDIRGVEIAIAPRSVQAEYAAKKRLIRASKLRKEKAIAESERLFASLQHRAFRGEL